MAFVFSLTGGSKHGDCNRGNSGVSQGPSTLRYAIRVGGVGGGRGYAWTWRLYLLVRDSRIQGGAKLTKTDMTKTHLRKKGNIEMLRNQNIP